MKRYLGWVPDVPDARDLRYTAPIKILKKLPDTVDLRKSLSGKNTDVIFDQGRLGSCVGNATAAAINFQYTKQKKNKNTPSRLAIYYGARELMGTVNVDSGCYIRDAFKVIAKYGAGSEVLWPYYISKFTKKPSSNYFIDAAKKQAVQYERVSQKIDQLKAAISENTPVVFGFSVYESLETYATVGGIVHMPLIRDRMLGGHAVIIVGYTNDLTKVHSNGKNIKLSSDDKKHKDWFIVKNSWGIEWGDNGYCYFPSDYITNNNLADDFWRFLLLEE